MVADTDTSASIMNMEAFEEIKHKLEKLSLNMWGGSKESYFYDDQY